MKEIAPTLDYFGQYHENFRFHVHQLIAWGYQDALVKIQSANKTGQQETAITGFIVEAVKNRLRMADRPKWLKRYSIQDDPPIESEGRSGRKRLRVDIIIEATFRGRPEYMFEAKRLKKPSYTVGKYIGDDGMGCFIHGSYGERYDEAAMLGYIQSDSASYWKRMIQDRIDKDAKQLCLEPPQNEVNNPKPFPNRWTSTHHRSKNKRSIRIFHILLDCSTH